MKAYNSPMLQVVGIKQNDIITSSPNALHGTYNPGWATLAPGERSLDLDDSWANAGY